MSYQYLAILRDGARQIEEYKRRRPQACPNDGEPLQPGPGGVLFCKFDGWRYPDDWVEPVAP